MSLGTIRRRQTNNNKKMTIRYTYTYIHIWSYLLLLDVLFLSTILFLKFYYDFSYRSLTISIGTDRYFFPFKAKANADYLRHVLKRARLPRRHNSFTRLQSSCVLTHFQWPTRAFRMSWNRSCVDSSIFFLSLLFSRCPFLFSRRYSFFLFRNSFYCVCEGSLRVLMFNRSRFFPLGNAQPLFVYY